MKPNRANVIYSAVFALLIAALGAWFADIGDFSTNVISLAGYVLMLLAFGLLADSVRRIWASQ